MSFYTCFDWFKKFSTFSYVLNLKIDVVPKASRAVVIGRFSLNEAPLGLFKFISDYLLYFEKINKTIRRLNYLFKKRFNTYTGIWFWPIIPTRWYWQSWLNWFQESEIRAFDNYFWRLIVSVAQKPTKCVSNPANKIWTF